MTRSDLHSAKVEPSEARSPDRAGASSLDGVSGPLQAANLLEHPALRGVLYPNPLDDRAQMIRELIDRNVEELTTRSNLVTPGVSIYNRPGDGEKSVIHLPGFREKETLTWAELQPFRDRDAAELQEVAGRIEARLGVPCDAAGALTVIVERMKTLLRESMMAAVETERERDLEYKIMNRESSLFHKMGRLLPWVKEKDQALQAELSEAKKEKELHIELHNGNYVRDPMRAGISLMRQRLDSLWHYRSPTAETGSEAGATEGKGSIKRERINDLSIALASVGVFQKGEGGWDQHYPSSPLRFWLDHIEPYLGR